MKVEMICEMNKQPKRLPCLITLLDRALRSVIAKIRVRFLVKPEFFSFFFNRLGCLLNCEGHFHFHVFIHRSKYESFHTFPFKKTGGGKKMLHYEDLSGVT